jgi:large subunit ribosomal protein L25
MTRDNQKTLFHVRSRDVKGKKTSQLRKNGLVPANIYGPSGTSQSIEVPTTPFIKLYEKEGDTGLIYLTIDDSKKQVPTLVDEVQYNSVSRQLLHVTFRQVSLTEKIEAEVPIQLVGESKVPGTTVVQTQDSLEVSALPTDLPESFEVDISTLLEVGQSITIADLDYDRSQVEIVFVGDMDETSPVVLLQEVKEEVEEEPETDEAVAEEATPEETEKTEAD